MGGGGKVRLPMVKISDSKFAEDVGVYATTCEGLEEAAIGSL